LPLFFDPWRYLNLEPTKVALFRFIVLGTALAYAWSSLSDFAGNRSANPLAPDRSSGVHTSRLDRLTSFLSANPLALPVVLYGGLYLLATILSVDPAISWLGEGNGYGAFTVLCTLIFFMVVANGLRSWHQVIRVIRLLIAGSVAVVIYGLTQYGGLDRLSWWSGTVSPVASTLGISTLLGAYLILVIPFTLALGSKVWGNETGNQAIYLTIFSLQILCLVLTMARAAVLACVVELVLFWWLYSSGKTFQRRALLAMLIAAAGTLLILFVYYRGAVLFPRPTESVTTERLIQMRRASNTIRLVMWERTISLVPAAWLFGYGPATFHQVYNVAYPPNMDPEIINMTAIDPHNIFLQHLLSLGIVGVGVFLWIIITFFRMMLFLYRRPMTNEAAGRERTIVIAIICAAIGYLLQAQFHPDAITSLSIFWLILALGACAYRLSVHA
jgi:O-antigen ligase